LGDIAKNKIPGDIFTYTTSSIFTLTESNVISVSSVFKNDVELGSGDWSFDATTNKVTVSASLTNGDTIEIQYSYYPNYSASEIQNYVYAAIVHLSINHFYNFEIKSSIIYPDPNTDEKNLIAMVTSLLIEPDNKSYSLPDISIRVPSDLPLHEKIRKTIAVFKKTSGHGNFDLL
jgi:hypothetical protein